MKRTEKNLRILKRVGLYIAILCIMSILYGCAALERKPTPTVLPLGTLEYTTNDSESVKNGNSGLFAYRLLEPNVKCKEYLIVDVDNGYAFFWQDDLLTSGFYARYKIESGDLNSGLSILGYPSEKEYRMYLKCRNQFNPEVLDGTDSDGDKFELVSMNLKDAQKLQNKRKLMDVSQNPSGNVTTEKNSGNALDFTNNTAENVYNGCSGLYSYAAKNKKGETSYFVIDLDNKYLYYFTDRGDEDCYARVLIENGNLKDGLICRIFNPNETITWNIKFHGKDNPNEIEIVFASDNSMSSLQRTNLNKALALMNTKYMIDRSVPYNQSGETLTPTPVQNNTTPTNTPIPTATPTPKPTSTPSPTPKPTNTPTPKPTNTPTPTPKPSVLTVDNCPELKTLMTSPPSGAATKAFWDKIGPCTVEVNCVIIVANANGRYLDLGMTGYDKSFQPIGPFLVCTNVHAFSIKKHNLEGGVLDIGVPYKMRAKLVEIEPESGQIRVEDMEFWPAK